MEENRREKGRLASSLPKDAQGFNPETYQRLKRFKENHPIWSERLRKCLQCFIAPDAIRPFDKPFVVGKYIYATDKTCCVRVFAGTVSKVNTRRLKTMHSILSEGWQPTPDMQSIFFKPTSPISTRFRSSPISLIALKSALIAIPHKDIFANCMICDGSGYSKCPCCNNFGTCNTCMGTGVSNIKIAEVPDLDTKINFSIKDEQDKTTHQITLWAYHANIIAMVLTALKSQAFKIHTITPSTYRVRPILDDFPENKAIPQMLFYSAPKKHSLGFGIPAKQTK